MNTNLESFQNSEIQNKRSSNFRSFVTRQVDVCNNPRNNRIPNRFNIVKSRVVPTKSNDVKNINHCGDNNYLALHAPTSIAHFKDAKNRGQIDVLMSDITQPIPQG
jgi:hypothetical protein